MGENENNQQDTPLDGQSSDGKSGSTSQSVPKTYTEQEINEAKAKARSDALAEAGRRYKPIEDENATLKSQLTNNQTLIKANQDAQEKLQKQIDDLVKDDPDKQKYVKRLRDLEGVEQKLRDDRSALEAEKAQHSERVKKAEAFERDYLITTIVEQYEGGEFDKLKTTADKLALTSEQSIRDLADSLWKKKSLTKEPPQPPIHVDSGVTTGGTLDIDKLSPLEKITEGLKRNSKK